METDWVKRKAIGEQFIQDEKSQIWKSLCQSLQSAVESYILHYGGRATGQLVNDRLFHISVRATPPYLDASIDVTFATPEIRVTCNRGMSKISTYFLNPNRDAPFLNKEHEQLNSDQVSEAILRTVFFPAESRGVQTRIVTPCTA